MAPRHGGAAFPGVTVVTEYDGGKQQYVERRIADSGMSLRDWIAGQVLPAILAASTNESRGVWDEIACAQMAYDFADAMLVAREAK